MSRRGSLLRKLLLAMLVPTALTLGGFGVLAHEVARRTLEEELGKRLAAAASGAALLVLPEQVAAIGAGDEGSLTYGRIQRSLEIARERFQVRRVALVARDLSGRGDTDGRIGLGARAHEFSADAVELERAASGIPASSPLFFGDDGRPYKRAYAPVPGPQQVAGFVAVEGSADYFVSLATFRRWLLGTGAVALALVVGFSVVLARHLTGPLGRLASAAERIGRGHLEAAVPIETRDEVGALAARLDEMRAALRARDERLQMMLAGIAHEVRNPLGGLELYAGLLREGLAGNPERLAEVARIEREIEHLGQVVTDFLAYARRPRPELAPVPVRALLDEVAEVATGSAQGGPSVTVEAAPELVARGDRVQLRRALVNLLRNGLAAAGPGGQVVLAARRAPGGSAQSVVEIEVRDSGAGVAPELRDKIFEPFFTTREKGTGLGLAFVREIARDHGGEIHVDQAPEGGARFQLRLPMAAEVSFEHSHGPHPHHR
jgi:signal transduction histidine kinase